MKELPEYFWRHALFYGEDAIKKLQNSTVLVAGVGGLGCTVSQLLVRSGVGTILLLENKAIDEPDLNRQILYTYEDLGKEKIEVAKERLEAISPYSKIVPIKMRLTETNAKELSKLNFDLIVDCFDNFEGRFLLEDILHKDQMMVHAGISNNFGQISVIKKEKTASLKELFGGLPKGQDKPIPVVPSAVVCLASFSANEAINCLLGKQKLVGKIVLVDLEDYSLSKIVLKK